MSLSISDTARDVWVSREVCVCVEDRRMESEIGGNCQVKKGTLAPDIHANG